jgi:hypothetical protein
MKVLIWEKRRAKERQVLTYSKIKHHNSIGSFRPSYVTIVVSDKNPGARVMAPRCYFVDSKGYAERHFLFLLSCTPLAWAISSEQAESRKRLQVPKRLGGELRQKHDPCPVEP